MLSHQSCPTLFDPMDYSSPGSFAHGILQTRILEWVVIPSPGDLPNPGMELESPASPTLTGGFFTIAPQGKPYPTLYFQITSVPETISFTNFLFLFFFFFLLYIIPSVSFYHIKMSPKLSG